MIIERRNAQRSSYWVILFIWLQKNKQTENLSNAGRSQWLLSHEGRGVSAQRGPQEDICRAAYTGVLSLWNFTGLYINDRVIFLDAYCVKKQKEKKKEGRKEEKKQWFCLRSLKFKWSP